MVAGKVFEFNLQVSDINILQIEPTTYCNARCPHCPRFDTDGNVHPALILDHLNIDAIESNLELDHLTNLHTVVLEGDKGDPLMHPKIDKLIDIFCQAPSQPTVKVFTNGSIRNPSWWKKLAEKNYKNLNVIFSIDGLRDTNHLYRVGLEYDTIMDNVKSFIDAGGWASWKFIFFKHNEHEFDAISQLSKDMGFCELLYTTCRPGDFQGLAQWPVHVDGQVSHFLQRPDTVRQGTVTHRARKISYHRQQVVERVCPNLVNGQLYITYLNQVIPCCMMHYDTTLNYPGKDRLLELTGGFDKQDLTKHSMSQILNHQLFKNELVASLHSGNWHLNCVRSCKSQILNNLKHVQS